MGNIAHNQDNGGKMKIKLDVTIEVDNFRGVAYIRQLIEQGLDARQILEKEHLTLMATLRNDKGRTVDYPVVVNDLDSAFFIEY